MRSSRKPSTPLPVGCVAAKAERTKAAGETPPGVCRCGDTLKRLAARIERLESAASARGASVVALGHLAGRAEEVLTRVCLAIGVPLKHLQHGGRTRALAEARWLAAAALAAEGIPHSGIARAMGWNTPSTVSHALDSHAENLNRPNYARAWALVSTAMFEFQPTKL